MYYRNLLFLKDENNISVVSISCNSYRSAIGRSRQSTSATGIRSPNCLSVLLAQLDVVNVPLDIFQRPGGPR